MSSVRLILFCLRTQVPLSFVLPRYLYVDFENEELGCVNQKQFSAGGAGALPIYWDKVHFLASVIYFAYILPLEQGVCSSFEKQTPLPSFILFLRLLPSD